LQGIWNGSQCVTEEPSGRKLFHFVLNNCVAKDNRIPPLGFVPGIETKPVGITYPTNPQHPGELVNWDINNGFATENSLCNRNLSVGPANQTRGAYMQSLWQNNGKSAPVVMGVSQTTIN